MSVVKEISVKQLDNTYITNPIGADAENIDIDSNTTLADKAVEWDDNSDQINAIVNVYGAKNLNSYPYYETTKTENGITFTDNGDGTITVNGTASADTQFACKSRTYSNFVLDTSISYVFSGCPDDGSSDTYYIEVVCTDGSSYHRYGYDYGSSLIVNPINNSPISFNIIIKSGTTVDNLTFCPMIRDARIKDDTWVPYAMTNKELTSAFNELNSKIIVSSTELTPGSSPLPTNTLYVVYE